MAYGTESVPRVAKIVGPGNLFVTLAKQQVYGDVGIDGLPGPTETMVIADASANPGLAAADLLAQAEPKDAPALPDLKAAVKEALSAPLSTRPLQELIPSTGDVVIISIPFTDGRKSIKRKGRVLWNNNEGFALEFF